MRCGRPLNASVRLPILVPQPVRNATKIESSLCFRGPLAAARSSTSCGVQTVNVDVVSHHFVCGSRCVNGHRSCHHKVPRSRARSTVVFRSSACLRVGAGSLIKLPGVRRCAGSKAPKSASLLRSPFFGCRSRRIRRSPGAESASAIEGVRQSNNAFERPVKPLTLARGQRVIHFAPSARSKALRPAAQRER